MAAAYQVAGLLDKMGSADKDYRFMATNDLMSELQKDSIKLDDDSERKIVRALLQLLEDKSGEVQNLAVKCLGPLVGKVEVIVDTLCANMVSNSEQLRDVSSIALKTVISELPPPGATHNQLAANVTRRILPKLTEAASSTSSTDASVRLEILDIIGDVLLRCGSVLGQYHNNVQEVLMEQLSVDRQALRKRSIVALSHLTSVCSTALYNATIERLVRELKANRTLSMTRTYVLAVASICRATGARFAEHLPQVLPILLTFCKSASDDELCESCLQAFEAFIFRCPKDVTPYMGEIVELCSLFLKHDPNYHYDDESGDNADCDSGMDADDGDEDDDDNEEYSDDDDVSWKVRRSAAKCIEAMISSRREQLAEFYSKLGPLLISRFKEREENVKTDIFQAYIALLRQTKLLFPPGFAFLYNHHDDWHSINGNVNDSAATAIMRRQQSLSDEQHLIQKLLENQVAALVRAVNRQLRSKSLKTRQTCFVLLAHLLKAQPGALSSQMQLLIPGVQASMSDRSNSQMKIDTLVFLTAALNSHEPEVVQCHMAVLVPVVTRAVADHFYKVSAEALQLTQALIRVLRPSQAASCTLDFTPYVSDIYAAVAAKLKATDIDQEVKEKAIAATGQLIATFGDYLCDQLPTCLPILLERLRNEMTRLVTVKALCVIVNSTLKINLDSILADVLPLLADFLRKNQRALKIATLNLLDSLVLRYTHGGLQTDGLIKALAETPALINEQDLQISQLTLRFINDVIETFPNQISTALPAILQEFVVLTQSALLQGATLNAALEMLDRLSIVDVPKKPNFEQLLDQLTAPVYEMPNLHRHAYLSIAKCTAVVAAAQSNMEKALSLSQKLAEQLEARKTSDGVRLFSLLALGELGRKCKGVYEGKNAIKPEALIVDAFNSQSEDLKTAASYSLGGLAVGNLEKFLPFLLKEINTQPKRQYLLLHALKEPIERFQVIGSEAVDIRTIEYFKPRIESIWPVLMEHSAAPEEGTRNVVAECIGKLCAIQPELLLPKLKDCVASPSERVRATAVTAVKFLIVDQPQAMDELLRKYMPDFLRAMSDTDLNVRRVALVAFNSAAHNKPKLVRDLLDEFLPLLYTETKVRKELVEEVEMGPFKHTVDKGLDMRKAAFESMYTLLESCLERLDVFEFITHMEDGLKDHHDIKLLTYLMLSRLCILCPTQVLQRIDRIVEPLKAQCVAKVKQNAVKQEVEKQDELKRAALRAVFVLQKVPEAERQPQLSELLAMIRATPELANMFQAVERDAAARHFGSDSPMDTD